MKSCAVALTLALGTLYSQQAPNPGLSFEAVSVKALKTPSNTDRYSVLPNRLEVHNMGLRFLIREAWNLPGFQIVAPESIDEHSFDVVATTPAPVSKAEMRIMLMNLLTDRFHLATHWDTRTESVYRLEVLPKGPTMTALTEGQTSANSPMGGENGAIEFTGPMSIAQLAEQLRLYAHKPVIDQTGLDGYFKIALKFTPDTPSAADDGGAPLLLKAIQQQLGLKLVPAKESIKILVIDHADEFPAEN